MSLLSPNAEEANRLIGDCSFVALVFKLEESRPPLEWRFSRLAHAALEAAKAATAAMPATKRQ
ncbi:MAG: hypothetical protein CFK52_07405 [Chloracidobacterium sp. CP2_5A]|nr:MAG: hypothetical protein CFK52_07405 [Chloracidobacterium sp. CP2_5A]